MPVGTYSPNASAVDGYVAEQNTNVTWAAKHDAADATSASDSDASENPVVCQAGTTTDRWSNMRRGFYLFDTSSLPDNAKIRSATFGLYITAVANDFNSSVCLVAGTPASDTAIGTADYDQFGTTQLASDVAISSISTNNYNNWTLNATGLGLISKTGITKFGLVSNHDRTNTAPTWASGSQSVIVAQFSEGANKPKLIVSYSLGAALNLTSKKW